MCQSDQIGEQRDARAYSLSDRDPTDQSPQSPSPVAIRQSLATEQSGIMFAGALVTALLYVLTTLLGTGASLHCAVRREISPCTCRREDTITGAILVSCQRMTSYDQVVAALQEKFSPETKISLEISHSELPDLPARCFKELALSITKLKLNFDNLSSELNSSAFIKLDLVEFFSVSDNSLVSMPRHVLRHLPHLNTLDVRRNKIDRLAEADFQPIQEVQHLVVADNQISKIDRHALPKALRHVHLGLNKLSTLNGALRDLDDLEWIFINANHLKTIDGELPIKATKLVLIHAAHNELQNLPKELKLLSSLESLYFYHNDLTSLDGTLQKSKKLQRVNLSFNKIESLAADDFAESDVLADLEIGYNRLKFLNGSLRHLRSLRYLNLTHNDLPEFSLQEIKGLKHLSVIDLSYNKISRLTGDMENLVDVETRVLELRLDHNQLFNLGGALMGLHGLLRLNVSHNLMTLISPDDLIGLDELRLLDVSYNHITTLEETSKTFLPALEELLAHHNNITILNKDFHGLPSLCSADLSYNQVRSINYELVTKTHCSIRGVSSTLKLYLQDNPVLCDERLMELVQVMESLNTRICGGASCPAPQTSAPVLLRALNDIRPPLPPPPPPEEGAPLPPAIILAHNLRSSIRVVPHIFPTLTQAQDSLDTRTAPSSAATNVVKWPDERDAQPRPPAPLHHTDAADEAAPRPLHRN